MASIDRRGLLAAGATLCGGAVAGLLAPDRAAAQPTGRAEEATANEDLMREHGVLRRVLILYREAAPRIQHAPAEVDPRAIQAAARLFRRFGEQYHERLLEEEHVFPAVRRAGGEAASLPDLLVAQHARGREITAYVLDVTGGGRIGAGDATSLARAMTGFARMYEAHAAREDTVVFPAFKRALGEARYGELGERFEEIERQQFGGDGFEMALREAAEAEAMLGIADLARFTALPPARRR